MRATGKTTRLVDEAIQHLFKYGYVRILLNHEIMDPNFYRGFTNEQILDLKRFIDPDFRDNNHAQLYLIGKIKDRIINEHGGSRISISKTEFKLK